MQSSLCKTYWIRFLAILYPMAHVDLTPARDAAFFAFSSTFPSHGNIKNCVCDVFKESQELAFQIEGTILTAFFHVAIFSPKYTESSWCLKDSVHVAIFFTRHEESSTDAGVRLSVYFDFLSCQSWRT